jgi:hypothetical protein
MTFSLSPIAAASFDFVLLHLALLSALKSRLRSFLSGCMEHEVSHVCFIGTL